MPINNSLPKKKFPMTMHWGKQANPSFKPALEAITIKMYKAPSRNQILSYLPEFCLATWEDRPTRVYSQDQREQCLKDLLQMKVLPNAMETIGFTFLVSNIDLIDVTHLIRHRAMTFSAHCTGDRDQRFDTVLVKPSITHSTHLSQYMRICEQAFMLYAKMLDEKEISILDARTILPRSLANHYYARVNLKDFITFLKQRLDKQIQPESDNIIAIRMLIEVAKIIPEIKYAIDLDSPDYFFIKTAQTDHSSNLYRPEPKNDIFDWNEQWFMYPRTRDMMKGGDAFVTLWNDLVARYQEITSD